MFILPAYGPETGFQFVLIAVAGVDQHQLHNHRLPSRGEPVRRRIHLFAIHLFANCAVSAKIDIMPTSRDLHPLTKEQEVQLRHDLTLVEERLQDITILMRVCFGEDSQVAVRADETAAALQRLKWELERTKLRTQAAGS